MNHHHTNPENGIAVLCAVKNRSDSLRYTIPTWLSQPGVEQLVLVDWDSEIPLGETLDAADILGWPDDRVTLIRVVEQPYWNMGKAINLGMRWVTQPHILKVDSDVAIVGFLSGDLPESGKTYISGRCLGMGLDNSDHLYGTFFFCANDFFQINGYDERFEQYGWEDTDLYYRLEMAGLERKFFEINELFHLPHSDHQRLVHQKSNRGTPEECIAASRESTLGRKRWSSEWSQSDYCLFESAHGGKRLIAQEVESQKGDQPTSVCSKG